MYKFEEHLFHLACNNFCHIKLNPNEIINLKEESTKNFYIIIKGEAQANYEKDLHPNDYANYFTAARRLISDSNSNRNSDTNNDININEICKSEEKYMNRILSEGDYFSETLKYKGYITSSIHAIEEVDLIYLNEENFNKIFLLNINKFEKNKRSFILKNIPNLCDIPYIRYETFLSRIDTMVLKYLL